MIYMLKIAILDSFERKEKGQKTGERNNVKNLIWCAHTAHTVWCAHKATAADVEYGV